MKKIPNATLIIVLFCLTLFGVFIINYRNYTTNLDTQFKAEALETMRTLDTINHSAIDPALSSLTDELISVVSSMKNSNKSYSNTSFISELFRCSNGTMKRALITSPGDLSTYNETTSLNQALYDCLANNEPILSICQDSIYLMIPYSVSASKIVAVYQTYDSAALAKDLQSNMSNQPFDSFLINDAGQIISSRSDCAYENLYPYFSGAVFTPSKSAADFKSEILSNQEGICPYKLNGTDYYVYYSPCDITGLHLIHLAPASLINQNAERITLIARKFMNTVLVIVFMLVIVIFFVAAMFTLKINQNRNSILLEQQRYKFALEHSKDTIWEYDVKKNILTKSNPDLGLCLGMPEVFDFRNTVLNNGTLNPADVDKFNEFCDLLISDTPEVQTEVRNMTSSGAYNWYELFGTKLFDSEHHPVSVIGRTSNIQKQKEEIEQLQLQSMQDPLTKLYNREAFQKHVKELIDSIDTPVIFGLLIIDIDHFKSINEKLGHLFGDAVLIDVSARLSKLFDKNDILARIGGDEFAVLVKDAPSVGSVLALAKQVHALFLDIYTGDETNIEITCSIGLSIYPANGNQYDTLYEKASLALYHSKQKGPNQTYRYDPSMDSLSPSDSAAFKNQTEGEIKTYHEERSLVDSTIIANAIEILFDSREIDVSINMMLSLIGVYYNLNQIQIVEFNEDHSSVMVTHTWDSGPDYKFNSEFNVLDYEVFKPYCFFTEGEYGTIHIDDFVSFRKRNPYLANLPKDMENVKSIFQCGISDHGSYIGLFNICICTEIHNWTKNEIDSLSLLSKIIGSYLMRLRSIQKFDIVSQMDLLTNTYNFNTFLKVVSSTISMPHTTHYAMMYSDIYQFKLFNDNYGYQAGDLILKKLADIFRDCSGPGSILSRITGDKYAMLIPYSTKEQLTDISNQILSKTKQFYSNDGELYKINVMIGIYLMSEHDTAIVSVDRANIARKNAQMLHKSNCVFFDDQMLDKLLEQKQMEDVMEDALLNEEFVVYYQPKINMNTQKACGAEALVRWQRPALGLIPPDKFIPLFEDNGFIVPLDYYVLDKVCEHIREKMDQNIDVFPISVNFSRAHFMNDDFVPHLLEAVQKYNIPSHLIEVEITESAFVNNSSYWLGILKKICAHGFGLAMDDFGSGLSSLNLLCDLPFKVLKIDKDFFHSKTANERERIVISNIVHMAQELDMEVICEGVETKEQCEFLQSIGCYMAQGYYYDKPLQQAEFDLKYLH